MGLLSYLGEGEREHACSLQVLSWWPGDKWHPSALSLALWSREQVKQDGRFCCVRDTSCCEGETQEVCNLWAGIACAWVQGSEQLRGDNQQDN